LAKGGFAGGAGDGFPEDELADGAGDLLEDVVELLGVSDAGGVEAVGGGCGGRFHVGL